MRVFSLFRSDSGQSLLQHAAKSVVALILNWLVLAQFSSADYVAWSVTCSVIAVATASDLGIGQYAVTRLIHSDPKSWAGIVGETLVALLPLALVSMIFVFVFINGQSVQYQLAMSVMLGFRILTIPFGAVLNAVNQFKIRKMIETGVYVLALVLIAAAARDQLAIETALLIFNGAFLLGGGATILAACGYLSLREVGASFGRLGRIWSVYRASAPFMVNNVSGVFTYGGFLWVGSFFLSKEDMVSLAILHTFVLMNLYQVYDVYLKSRQADLVRPTRIRSLRAVNGFVVLAIPLGVALIGVDVWRALLPDLPMQRLELFLFSVFIALELGSLFIQSLSQVSVSAARWLGHYAIVKLLFQALALALYMKYPLWSNLAGFLAWLVACSAVAYVVVASHSRSAQGGSWEFEGTR